jgi:hypothetical protein
MRQWLIGCGVVAALLVVLVVWGWNHISKEYEEISGRLDVVKAEYRRLDRDYAFQRPADGVLTSEQVGRFVACREALLQAPAYEKWFQPGTQEDPSLLDLFTRLGDMLSSLGGEHVKALGKVHMSPTEYLWILNQVLVVLRFAESPGAPQGLKDLRLAYDVLPEEEASRQRVLMEEERAGSNGDESTSTGNSGTIQSSWLQTMQGLLPSIDANHIALPDSMVQAVLDHRSGLEATLEIFLHFDASFKTVSRELAVDRARDSLEPGLDEEK